MKPLITEKILTHLYTRFLLNLPQDFKDECRVNFIRIFFELETAYWFYLDNLLENPSVGGIDFISFCEKMFDKYPSLVPRKVNWRLQYREWKNYRGTTPTGSAIILDESLEMVLLVKGFEGNRWTFPGGKVNENEDMLSCAIREVMEETSLDIEHYIKPNVYLDRNLGDALRRTYIVEGIPRYSFIEPNTNYEIEAILWFKLEFLPSSVNDPTPLENLKMRPNQFYLIGPFINQLKNYVQIRRDNRSSEEAIKISRSNYKVTEFLDSLQNTPSSPLVDDDPFKNYVQTVVPKPMKFSQCLLPEKTPNGMFKRKDKFNKRIHKSKLHTRVLSSFELDKDALLNAFVK